MYQVLINKDPERDSAGIEWIDSNDTKEIHVSEHDIDGTLEFEMLINEKPMNGDEISIRQWVSSAQNQRKMVWIHKYVEIICILDTLIQNNLDLVLEIYLSLMWDPIDLFIFKYIRYCYNNYIFDVFYVKQININ